MRGLMCNYPNNNGCGCNQPNNNCDCQCVCKCTCVKPQPQGVKALVQSVLDSCNQCLEVKTEINLPITANTVPGSLPPIGTCIPINSAGPVSCQEISRECTCDGMCLSTVLFNYPLQLHNPCNPCDAMFYNVTSMQNVALKCTADSQLDCLNTRILSVKAVVTQVDCDNITITINLLADTIYRQTCYQEICIPHAYETNKRPCDRGKFSPCDIAKKMHR